MGAWRREIHARLLDKIKSVAQAPGNKCPQDLPTASGSRLLLTPRVMLDRLHAFDALCQPGCAVDTGLGPEKPHSGKSHVGVLHYERI